MPHYPTSWRSILILSSHLYLCLPNGFFPSCFPTKTLYAVFLPHMCYIPQPTYYSQFDHPNNIWWGVEVIKLLIMQFPPLLLTCWSEAQIFSSASYFQIPSASILPSMCATEFHTHTKQHAML
jgi:hypothetical protein